MKPARSSLKQTKRTTVQCMKSLLQEAVDNKSWYGLKVSLESFKETESMKHSFKAKIKPLQNPQTMKRTKNPLQTTLQHIGVGNPHTVGDREVILGVHDRYLCCFETLPYLQLTSVVVDMLDGLVLPLILLSSMSKLTDRRKLFFHMFYFKIILCEVFVYIHI